MAGEFWFQLFSCVAEQEQEQRRRPRIDRSMIGQPMDFRHTGHVGSSDLGSIGSLQTQMRGKGGESINIQVPHILNARSIHDIQRHSIKAWLPTMYPSHTIMAWRELLLQSITPATPSRHDSNYSVKGWLQPLLSRHDSSHTIKARLQLPRQGMTPATLPRHDSSHNIKARLQLLRQGMTPATLSKHDPNYSVKGWLQPLYQGMTPSTLSALFQPLELYQGELQSLHKGMTRPITPGKHYLTTPSRYYSKTLYNRP